MTRQSIRGITGEERVLDLKEFKRNPGRKAIEGMSRDWPTLGAKDKNAVAQTAAIRLNLYQVIIDSVENGTTDLGKLETTLNDHKDATRQFVESCLGGRTDSAEVAKWREIPLPEMEKARDFWLKEVPGAKLDDEEGFKKFIGSPKFRETFRNGMVEIFLNVEGANDKLTSLLFGNVWKQLRTRDETGQAAKDLLGKSACRAFLDLMIERRMNQVWGDPRNLD